MTEEIIVNLLNTAIKNSITIRFTRKPDNDMACSGGIVLDETMDYSKMYKEIIRVFHQQNIKFFSPLESIKNKLWKTCTNCGVTKNYKNTAEKEIEFNGNKKFLFFCDSDCEKEYKACLEEGSEVF